jgi:hypothetical protein
MAREKHPIHPILVPFPIVCFVGFLAHLSNEITQATIDLRAPCPLLGFPAPESFPARAMPPKDRLRLNDLGRTDQVRPEPDHPYQQRWSLPRSRRRGGACLKAMLS